jgi:hypothetical protein
MTENDIRIWIEKYFEGLTSLDEEQKLRDYLQQENVPQDLEMYKPLFQYFVSERETATSFVWARLIAPLQPNKTPLQPHKGGRKRFWLRWGSIAAAACLLLFISVRLFLNTSGTLPETSQAYIDGKKYTDIELIRTETLKSLENLSEGSEDAYSSQIEALEIFTK